MDIAGV
jgi:hypothetical protein